MMGTIEACEGRLQTCSAQMILVGRMLFLSIEEAEKT